MAQGGKAWKIERNDSQKTVKVEMRAGVGNCCILAGNNNDSLYVRSSDAKLLENLEYKETTDDNQRSVWLHLKGRKEATLTNTITDHFFGSNDNNKCNFDLKLPQSFPLDLRFDYAVGTSNINLTELPVQNLKIKTGGANVNISYEENESNRISMDSLTANVDMGSLYIDNLGSLRAGKILAEVCFGTMDIGFPDTLSRPTEVKANIGAGKLIMRLPKDKDIPVKVVLGESSLCDVVLDPDFSKASSGVYTNKAYSENAKNPMIVHVDVGMGSVILRRENTKTPQLLPH
ncbi:hypothetical protein FUAX_35490 [Fulvitalea axinellae]|uniref:Adhesin domain-containing protein n=1 Tax=Fulvitalea axinellae TaxID=1182444 RepID=A0AAU9CVQ5_9BACT|nr:hypothetical protein FUAX_35490 [Fulvitalea axinellae]